MFSPRMLSNLSSMACTFLSSTFFLLLLHMQRSGKSRASPSRVSGKDEEVVTLDKRLPTYCPSG